MDLFGGFAWRFSSQLRLLYCLFDITNLTEKGTIESGIRREIEMDGCGARKRPWCKKKDIMRKHRFGAQYFFAIISSVEFISRHEENVYVLNKFVKNVNFCYFYLHFDFCMKVYVYIHCMHTRMHKPTLYVSSNR